MPACWVELPERCPSFEDLHPIRSRTRTIQCPMRQRQQAKGIPCGSKPRVISFWASTRSVPSRARLCKTQDVVDPQRTASPNPRGSSQGKPSRSRPLKTFNPPTRDESKAFLGKPAANLITTFSRQAPSRARNKAHRTSHPHHHSRPVGPSSKVTTRKDVRVRASARLDVAEEVRREERRREGEGEI